MSAEKRLCERSDVLLIVEFRHLKQSEEYSLGITNNFSLDGFNFETLGYNPVPGDVLEFNLKHPHANLSVPAVGEIVWKKEGWYSRISGVKLREIDRRAVDKILEFQLPVHNVPLTSSPSLPLTGTGTNIGVTPEPQWVALQSDSTLHEWSMRGDTNLPKERDPIREQPTAAKCPPQCNLNNNTASAAAPGLKAGISLTSSRMFLKRKFHLPSWPLFSATAKAALEDAVTALRSSSEKTWLHIPTAFIAATIATLVLSMEFDRIRKDRATADTLKKGASVQRELHTAAYHSAGEDLMCEQDSRKTAPFLSYDLCNDLREHSLTTSIPSFPVQKNTEKEGKYLIQVGAWKNSDYAEVMMRQLAKEYPSVYIISKNHFQVMLVPGIESRIHGHLIADSIKAKYHLEPILISTDSYRDTDHNQTFITHSRVDTKAPSVDSAHRFRRTPLSGQVTERLKRRIKPKSVYRVLTDTADKATSKSKDSFLVPNTVTSVIEKIKENGDDAASRLKRNFFTKTLHRKPGLVD